MKNRHQTESVTVTEPLTLNELTERFPLVADRAAVAARLHFGSGRQHLVEEVVNDVLLQLWQRQRVGRLPEKPEAWAYTVALNRAARVARLEGRYASGLVEQVEDLVENPAHVLMPPNEVTPVNGAELTDRLAAFRKLLSAFVSVAKTHLNEREATLFELLYVQRLTGDKAALQMGVTTEVVRQQWSRLLTKLLGAVRHLLQEDPLCNELLSSVLSNEKTFRRTLLQLLRLVMRKGVQELESLVSSTLKN